MARYAGSNPRPSLDIDLDAGSAQAPRKLKPLARRVDISIEQRFDGG
jgi:hypothetical protein